MFKRLFSREVEEFAIELAREFFQRCPPEKSREGSQSAIGLAKAVDDVCNRAADFQRSKRLGMYRKARFGTEFKLQMKDLGYEPEFVNELVGRLLIKMSGAD